MNDETLEAKHQRLHAENPVFQAIESFEKVQARYRDFGAEDTEPREVFWSWVLERCWYGRDVPVPRTGDHWQLFTHTMDTTEAAEALTAAALAVETAIDQAPCRVTREALVWFQGESEL